MTVPAGHRFEATQALRQLLARAVVWNLLDVNPAKLGVENPQRRYREKRPFDCWEELHALRRQARPTPWSHGALRRSDRASAREWLALEQRDIDREARVVYVRRTFRSGHLRRRRRRRACAPSPHFRTRAWKPAQRAAGIEPLRRAHDLRNTFATFALRAGTSTFDLSRYMGTSLAMIDRH